MVSFDTQDVAQRKADFIVANGLLGAMVWELSGDHTVASGKAIVPTVASRFGAVLDRRPNHLSYPKSKFDNLRSGMP